MNTDVKSIRVTATGSVTTSRSRIHAVNFASSAASRVTFTDGPGGPVVFDLDGDATDTTSFTLPHNGILCEKGIEVSTLTGITGLTVIYTG